MLARVNILPHRKLKFQTSLGYTETLSQRKKTIISNKIINPVHEPKMTFRGCYVGGHCPIV